MGSERKKAKELKRRYGKLAESMHPYYDRIDLRPLFELDDDGFLYIMEQVKGVGMLDLNETEIGNESIRRMAELEYVKELRIKSCHKVDNDAIPFLDKINGLELLHVKATGITIDGLLQLKELNTLKTLLFSDEQPENLPPKMKLLQAQFPHCEFIIDGKTWEEGSV